LKLTSENARCGDEAGLAARRSLGLPIDQPLDDILRALERTAGVEVFSRPLGDTGIEGACLTTRGRSFILLNSSKPPVRQRFTLAHEYGHLFLNHGTSYDVALSWGNSDPKEVQANYFAASFLMPEPAITTALRGVGSLDFDGLVTLAAQFGVSAPAMRIRLDTVDAVDRGAAQAFDELIAQGRHKAAGVAPTKDSIFATQWSGGRMPPAMTAKVLDAVRRDLLTEDQAATLLRADVERLNVLRDELELAVE